ncbi:uncharacterized protein LOC126668414 [Mercurialis annua]|uniref:uncharacterized protein LOC126668414 n=1 Tax=Mercurialis annua TaxID=3986 RepID=UPI00215E7CB7|nr:uncharacterized protein LOC126668414 [Mercurialis annua]
MTVGFGISIRENLPEVEHRRRARHVYAAIAKSWKGEDRKLGFWTAAKSTFVQQLRENLKKLELMGPSMVQDVLVYDVETFCKAYFKTTVKCDVIDNNLAETFNGWILDARCLPIISMLEAIRVQVMTRLHVKRRLCQGWINDIAPRAMKKLERNKELSYLWQILWNGDDGYEVTSIYDANVKHTVNTTIRACTCREWNLTGIPCQHAISAIFSAKEKPEDYVHDWYKEEKYKAAYSFMMQPVKGQNMWPKTGFDPIEPPAIRKMPGRPKKARKRDCHEIKKIGRLSRHGRQMRCKHCHEVGHSIRGCPTRDHTIPLPTPKKRTTEASTSQVVKPSAELVEEFTKTTKKGKE